MISWSGFSRRTSSDKRQRMGEWNEKQGEIDREREREEVTRNKKTSISRHSRVSAVVKERQRPLALEPPVNSSQSCASTFAFANRAQDSLATSTSQRISRSRISANKYSTTELGAFPLNQRFDEITETDQRMWLRSYKLQSIYREQFAERLVNVLDD